MLYQICPKCNFRLQATRHICGTCGHVVNAKKSAETQAEPAPTPLTAQPASFWKSLFGDNRPAASDRHEEPALET